MRLKPFSYHSFNQPSCISYVSCLFQSLEKRSNCNYLDCSNEEYRKGQDCQAKQAKSSKMTLKYFLIEKSLIFFPAVKVFNKLAIQSGRIR